MHANLLAAMAGLLLGLATVPATAAILIVDTNIVDLGDIDPGDGECAFATFPPVGQRCTLRAAVAEANALSGEDLIIIPVGMTIVLENGQIAIGSDMTIGAFLEDGDERPVVDADSQSRIFKIDYAPSSVRIANLVIRNGRALGGQDENAGGAIEAEAGDYELSIENCEFTGNAAGGGGAIVSQSSELRIVDSTLAGNYLDDPVADVNPFGSAVWVANGATTSIERSTFALNFSLRAAGGPAITAATSHLRIENSTIDTNGRGGLSSPTPDLTILNSTISNNDEFGIEMDGAGSVALSIHNSIVADNEVGCSFHAGFFFNSASYSLDEDDSCGFFPGAGNLDGVDPKLGPLADNGGRTATKALLPGSPAIDAGDPLFPGTSGSCLTTDQRGVSRPQPSYPDGPLRCDMGAVEVPEPEGAGLAAIALVALARLRRVAPLSSPIRRRGAARRSRRARAAVTGPR